MEDFWEVPMSEARRNPVDELAEEFVERYRRGERPAISEYTNRHPELAEEIHEVFPALVMIEEAGPEEPWPVHARAASITADGRPLEQLGDYHILRQIGRGGMGVVYEAVQEALGRHVALKVLPFTLSSDPTHLKRFRREARSAARLHHTNIVPVFDIGESRGIHYYAMQFIQGQGLDEVLQELRRLRGFRSPTNGAPSVEKERGGEAERGRHLELRNEIYGRDQSFSLATGLLTGQFRRQDLQEENQEVGRSEVRDQKSGDQKSEPGASATGASASDVRSESDSTLFLIGGSSEFSAQSEYHFYRSVARVGLQVAEALAYAHGQKVLHRDIKPSNLLLDLQGTIWVTDFGLAKEEESDDLTRTGDIVGTLRYMAPERFSGQADRRSDIYSLGMTLYELLSLRPAFAEMDRARLIQRITREEPPRPRKIDARIPRDLETIVCKAIAKEPAARYPTAEALAEDFRRFLADRPIRARRASFMEKSLRWCRRNPALAWLAATLLLALLSGTAGIAWQWRRAEANYQAARAQRARADANARKARAALDEAFTRVSESKLIQVPGAQPLRRELLQAALGYYRDFLDEARDDPELQADAAAAYFRVASANILLNQGDSAVAALQDGLDLVEKLLAEHPEDRELPKRLAGFLRSARVLHDDNWLLSKTRRDENTFRRASKLWERFARDYPAIAGFRSDLALLALLQVEEPREGNDGNEALSFCGQARELMETLVGEHPDELVYHELLRRAYYASESVLNALDRHAEAEVLVREAVAFFERQAVEHPDLPHPRFDQAVMLNILGHVLGETGRPTEAQAVHQRSVGILEELYKNLPDEVAEELATSHHDLGNVYQFFGRSAEAERAFRRAKAIWEKLVTALPGDPNFQHELAKNCYSLGELLALQNRLEEAEKVFGQGVQLEEKLADQYPDLGKYALEAWRCRRHLACLLLAVGREQEAERIVRESQDYLQKRKTENATKPEYWRSLADNQRLQAHLLALGKRPEEAAVALEHCIALVRERPAFFREGPFLRGHLEGSTWFLLELLNRSRRYPQAELVRRQIVDLYQRLASLDADNPAFLVHETGHLLSLAGWLRSQSRPKAAEQVLPRALGCYRSLTSRFPQFNDQAPITFQLGDQLREAGRSLEAAEAYRRAFDGYQVLALQFPNEVIFRKQMGLALHQQGIVLRDAGQLHSAERAWRQALDIYQRLAAENPADLWLQQEVAHRQRWLSGLLSQSHPRDAEELLRRALSRFEDLARLFSHDLLRCHLQASTQQLLGDLLSADRPRQAEAVYRQALTLYQEQPPEALSWPGVADEMEQAYQTFVKLLHRSGRKAEAADTQRRLATQYERQLTAAVQLRPQEWCSWVVRARFHARQKLWARAASDFERVLALLPDEWLALRLEYACVLQLSEDRTGWQRLGANALERLRQFPDRREAAWATHFAARICALAPNAGVGSDEIVRLAEEAVAADANPWNLHTLALAYYRAGRLDEAAERTRQSMEHSAWSGQPLNWLVLALVDHGRGDSAAAKQWLDKAERTIPQDLFSHEMYFNDWVESMVLLGEAQAAMEMQGTGNKPVP